MAGKTIGGLDVTTKDRFDARQAQLGAGSANETLIALLDAADGNDVMSAFDDIEVAGVKEVKRIIAGAARQMVLVLSHRYDEQVRLTEADAKTIEALREAVVGLEEQRDAGLANIADRDSTIADLRVKAASVDKLSERIDKMVETFDRQVERYESDLAKSQERLDQMTAERDGLAEQLKAMTSEHDSLTSEVERLKAELAEVKANA